MADDTTTLTVAPRPVEGSRSTRRLRRSGLVPGVVYGGGGEPLPFQVDARELRLALAHAGAVITLTLDGQETPVVLKDQQRHPVTGLTTHIDLLRVDLTQTIHATVVLELTGVEDAPGVKAGGVLEQITRELNVEALPTSIPDTIVHDVSAAEIGDTITLAAVTVPEGVTLLDDLETVVVTVTPPRLSVEPSDELEQETEVVGEGGAEAEASAEDESGGE
jgi:large subunit ribosomal protein L25